MDFYKYAAQNNLRFASNHGALTVEQLFELPLSSKSGFDLDSVAKGVSADLKDATGESFVATAPNPRKAPLEAALELVKDVIATKQAENAAALSRQHRSEERRKLLDAIGAKKDQALTAASLEDLEAKLAALD